MSWTSPRTWVAGETLTAALLNTHVRDNEIDIDSRLDALESAQGWVVLGTGAGTSTGVVMTEPDGAHDWYRVLLDIAISGSRTVTVKINATTTAHDGQIFSEAADAIVAADSLDYSGATAYQLTAGASLGRASVEATFFDNGNSANLISQAYGSGTARAYYAGGSNTAIVSSITDLTWAWGVSVAYKYAILGLAV